MFRGDRLDLSGRVSFMGNFDFLFPFSYKGEDEDENENIGIRQASFVWCVGLGWVA